jgi:uncharacterized glyoxalase superfamily protein PhnB
MLENRSIPRCTVIPELAYTDIGKALEWLSAAFGFTLRLRIANHRAQMNVGDGALALVELPGGQSLPVDIGCSVMVRVENVDQHCARAVQNGAKVIRPPADYPYGERQYAVEDFAGRLWKFSQTIADVDPATWGGTAGER